MQQDGLTELERLALTTPYNKAKAAETFRTTDWRSRSVRRQNVAKRKAYWKRKANPNAR